MSADRNRQIAKLLKQAFPGHKVSVRGGRGTSYGWVYINIGYLPRTDEEFRQLNRLVMQLIKAAKIEVGFFCDDMGGKLPEVLVFFR